MNILVLVISFAFIIFGVSGIIWGYFSEKKSFNNGICPNCGKPMSRFDIDSHGDREYHCDNCNYTTWVSWNIIDKK